MKGLKNIFVALKSINRGVIAILVLVLVFTACAYNNDMPIYQSKAQLAGSVLTYQPATLSGTTTGDPNLLWVLQVVEGSDFCSAVYQSGSVGLPFSLKFTVNMGDKERTAVVRITFTDGYSNTFTIRQLAQTENPTFDRPWAEQPEYREGSSLVYKTYYTTTSSNRRIRNYSICYDTDKLVSQWVAYPVHQSYIGNSGRTDEWSFDDAYYSLNPTSGEYKRNYVYTTPIIPTSKQQNIADGGYGKYGYDRGHMLPSASRLLNYNTNAQTFYATNMMPQQSQFNQKVWANLEEKVRSWSCADTLYVVVGTLFENSSTITSRGRTITVPSHAYKLVLRTKSGNTKKHISDIKSADELKCIGFLFENNQTGAATSVTESATSVAEIEQRAGFSFFRNLAPEIADEVKSQKNLSDWGM